MTCRINKTDKTGKTVCVLVFIFFLQLTYNVDGRRKNRPDLRIHLGKDVPHDKYPYVVVLIMKFRLYMLHKFNGTALTKVVAARVCTCSLIKREWVLSAAHCVRDMKHISKNYFRIIYGDLTIPPNNTKFEKKIRRVVIHPRYVDFLEGGMWRNDIALLSIEPLDMPIANLSAVDYKSLIGYPVTYLGAGGTHALSGYLSNNKKQIEKTEELDQVRPLQGGEAIVVKCALKKEFHFRVVYPGICLQSKCSNPGQSVIPGDSGGPLLFKDKIVGVASLAGVGEMAYTPNLKSYMGPPGSVYTAVSPYLDWINRVITQESTKYKIYN